MIKNIVLTLTTVLYLCQSSTVYLSWNRNVGNQGTTTINEGDTVQWVWSEARGHSVQSTGSPAFSSSSVVSTNGYTYSVKFSTSGSYSYRCSIHNNMQGVIKVVALSTSPTRSPTRNPTVSPSSPPTAFPTHHTATSQPSSSYPTSVPSLSLAPSLVPSSSSPSLSPITNSPSLLPTGMPTYSIDKILDNDLSDLPVISSGESEASTWAFTLTVMEHRHSNAQVAFTTRSYCYEGTCMYPGPSIRILPGDNFTLTLINNLGPEASSIHHHNTIHSPNTTNIHTHGLHIDPNVDTVFVKAGPGETLVYQYHLPVNHAPGLHWYHAHHHGSSALQLMGGLVGAMIVEPDASNSQRMPSSLLQADGRVLVITKLMLAQETSDGEVSQGCGLGWSCDAESQGPLCTGTETESPYNAFRLYSLQELSDAAKSVLDIDPVLTNPAETNLDLVNGQYRPVVHIVVDSAFVFRVVHAAGGGPLVLTLSDPTVCAMTVLAWDGVYLDGRLPQTEVHIVAASRVEIEVVCSDEGLFSVNNVDLGSVVWYMYANTSGTIYPSVTDSDLESIERPDYLQDLTDSALTVDSEYSVFISQEGRDESVCGFWMGAGSNCSAVEPMGDLLPSSTYAACPFGQFEGSRGSDYRNYKNAGKLVTYVGALNEWTLFGLGSAFHPLHVHVNHMQIMSTSSEASGSDSYYRKGQWRDTIPPVANHVKLRFRAAHFAGETVLHCHFQRHEDLGMMDTYLVMNESAFRAVHSPSSAPSSPPTSSPTMASTLAPTTFPTIVPTSSPTSLHTTARLAGEISCGGDQLSGDQLAAMKIGMEKTIGRGCNVTLRRSQSERNSNRRSQNQRQLSVAVIFFLSLVLEDSADLTEETFFTILTAEIEQLVTSGALMNATNKALSEITGGVFEPVAVDGISTDPSSVDFDSPDVTDDGDDEGKCSDEVYRQCVENIADNDGDFAYCDMCICVEYEGYGGSGSCEANNILYNCFLSDSACKTQLKQSWIIGFAFIAMFLCLLVCGCVMFFTRKRNEKCSIQPMHTAY